MFVQVVTLSGLKINWFGFFPPGSSVEKKLMFNLFK